jgi:hypothetical protein
MSIMSLLRMGTKTNTDMDMVMEMDLVTDMDTDMEKDTDTDTWHGHGHRNFMKLCTVLRRHHNFKLLHKYKTYTK